MKSINRIQKEPTRLDELRDRATISKELAHSLFNISMTEITPFNHPVYEALKGRRFVLASTSPRRLEILNSLGFTNVEIIASNFPEDLDKSQHTPENYVLNTAIAKGKDVFEAIKTKGESVDLILAADTVVEVNGTLFEKPRSREEHLNAIKTCRDSAHPVRAISGVALFIVKGEGSSMKCTLETFTESTEIIMDKDATDAMIEAYVNTGEGSKVAGGFKIQGFGALFMKGVIGDYMNVVGLPFTSTFKTICHGLDVSL